jgi:molecular chaperone DnaK
VRFEISSDGIVSVSATDLDTGKEQSITVTASSSLTEDEIEAMIEENEDYLMELKEGEELEKHRTHVQKTIRDLEKMVENVDESDFDDGEIEDAREEANAAVDKARRALEGQDIEQMIETGEALDQALQTFRGMVRGN